jgi:biopolymer transport protein ExbB/TolQ
MIRYFMMGGFVMWPLLVLALVILVLTILNAVRMLGPRGGTTAVRSSIAAILFWGAVAAVLGFVGQWNGYYKAGHVILESHRINPSAVALGFGEALVSAVAGLTILIAAAILWYLLHLRWSALAGRSVAE